MHRWLNRALWLALALYGGWLVQHAHGELTRSEPVEVGGRTFWPPVTVADGDLIDRRAGSLAAEICRRYRPDRPCPPAPAQDTLEAWSPWLSALAFQPVARTGPGDGLPPRLLKTSEGLWLVVASWVRRPVIFDPARGTVLLTHGATLAEAPALTLEP